MLVVGAGAILSVGLLRSISWPKMQRRFDVDGGVSGGTAFQTQGKHKINRNLLCELGCASCEKIGNKTAFSLLVFPECSEAALIVVQLKA